MVLLSTATTASHLLPHVGKDLLDQPGMGVFVPCRHKVLNKCLRLRQLRQVKLLKVRQQALSCRCRLLQRGVVGLEIAAAAVDIVVSTLDTTPHGRAGRQQIVQSDRLGLSCVLAPVVSVLEPAEVPGFGTVLAPEALASFGTADCVVFLDAEVATLCGVVRWVRT